jgi:hypothetical protein
VSAGLGAARGAGRAALALACALAAGCGQPPEPEPEVTPLPACASVPRFGNGARCDEAAGGLQACGDATRALCAGGWLCFDDAARAACRCQADADCQGRASYINQARAARKIAPLPARCLGGRCSGVP